MLKITVLNKNIRKLKVIKIALRNVLLKKKIKSASLRYMQIASRNKILKGPRILEIPNSSTFTAKLKLFKPRAALEY